MSVRDYVAALDALDADLDVAVQQSRRVEQRFLRQTLFAGRDLGTCAICGRELPSDLLVAAHIKKRSACTREEKLDLPNIVMPACRLGCDELYERGYLTVNQRGTVIAASVALPAAVVQILESLEGRACSAHSEGSAKYFAEHQESVFLDRLAESAGRRETHVV